MKTSSSDSGLIVAPHAGAWIETFLGLASSFWVKSPLTRGRGSKPLREGSGMIPKGRPSRGGVDRNPQVPCQLPHVRSPLTRGHGSKLRKRPLLVIPMRRPSRGGVDRNVQPSAKSPEPWKSPLTRGRGSKPNRNTVTMMLMVSPLTRGRGSKRRRLRPSRARRCRPSRGGVDRNPARQAFVPIDTGRPFRGGMNRNTVSTPRGSEISSIGLQGARGHSVLP